MTKFRWVITDDTSDNEAIQSGGEKGRGNHALAKAAELPYQFRLYDGDDNLYYTGRSNDRDSEDAFIPLEWAEADSGCAYIEYLQDDGNWEML